MITHVFLQLVLFAGMLFLLLLFLKMHHATRQESNERIDHIEKKFTTRILQAEVNMQELTYNEIAMDIHDHVSHTLALCKMQLEQGRVTDGLAQTNALQKTEELLSDAISFLSGFSRRLNDDQHHATTLPDAIQRMISFYPSSLPIHIQVIPSGSHYSLGPPAELHVYRIVQEALGNIVKHSKATRASISLNYSSVAFECVIRDDGIGFDQHAAGADFGSGFRNMKRRAALIGGILEISSIPFNGTIIRIYLPSLNQN